ncbi:hypothetical protein CCUS01_16408 [Colletotrichum cuscutae]|uniref:Uncharacterized protein n=1 Tax=Colletotrichum cuscutae TaxID=1209917 RepID=A0AAI9Y6E8_9PEZI|nr:hypothetical protein CCUS01_16408 [Colletotrichum cuscutae]
MLAARSESHARKSGSNPPKSHSNILTKFRLPHEYPILSCEACGINANSDDLFRSLFWPMCNKMFVRSNSICLLAQVVEAPATMSLAALGKRPWLWKTCPRTKGIFRRTDNANGLTSMGRIQERGITRRQSTSVASEPSGFTNLRPNTPGWLDPFLALSQWERNASGRYDILTTDQYRSVEPISGFHRLLGHIRRGRQRYLVFRYLQQWLGKAWLYVGPAPVSTLTFLPRPTKPLPPLSNSSLSPEIGTGACCLDCLDGANGLHLPDEFCPSRKPDGGPLWHLIGRIQTVPKRPSENCLIDTKRISKEKSKGKATTWRYVPGTIQHEEGTMTAGETVLPRLSSFLQTAKQRGSMMRITHDQLMQVQPPRTKERNGGKRLLTRFELSVILSSTIASDEGGDNLSRATTIAARPVLPVGGPGQKLVRFATSRGSEGNFLNSKNLPILAFAIDGNIAVSHDSTPPAPIFVLAVDYLHLHLYRPRPPSIHPSPSVELDVAVGRYASAFSHVFLLSLLRYLSPSAPYGATELSFHNLHRLSLRYSAKKGGVSARSRSLSYAQRRNHLTLPEFPRKGDHPGRRIQDILFVPIFLSRDYFVIILAGDLVTIYTRFIIVAVNLYEYQSFPNLSELNHPYNVFFFHHHIRAGTPSDEGPLCPRPPSALVPPSTRVRPQVDIGSSGLAQNEKKKRAGPEVWSSPHFFRDFGESYFSLGVFEWGERERVKDHCLKGSGGFLFWNYRKVVRRLDKAQGQKLDNGIDDLPVVQSLDPVFGTRTTEKKVYCEFLIKFGAYLVLLCWFSCKILPFWVDQCNRQNYRGEDHERRDGRGGGGGVYRDDTNGLYGARKGSWGKTVTWEAQSLRKEQTLTENEKEQEEEEEHGEKRWHGTPQRRERKRQIDRAEKARRSSTWMLTKDRYSFTRTESRRTHTGRALLLLLRMSFNERKNGLIWDDSICCPLVSLRAHVIRAPTSPKSQRSLFNSLDAYFIKSSYIFGVRATYIAPHARTVHNTPWPHVQSSTGKPDLCQHTKKKRAGDPSLVRVAFLVFESESENTLSGLSPPHAARSFGSFLLFFAPFFINANTRNERTRSLERHETGSYLRRGERRTARYTAFVVDHGQEAFLSVLCVGKVNRKPTAGRNHGHYPALSPTYVPFVIACSTPAPRRRSFAANGHGIASTNTLKTNTREFPLGKNVLPTDLWDLASVLRKPHLFCVLFLLCLRHKQQHLSTNGSHLNRFVGHVASRRSRIYGERSCFYPYRSCFVCAKITAKHERIDRATPGSNLVEESGEISIASPTNPGSGDDVDGQSCCSSKKAPPPPQKKDATGRDTYRTDLFACFSKKNENDLMTNDARRFSLMSCYESSRRMGFFDDASINNCFLSHICGPMASLSPFAGTVVDHSAPPRQYSSHPFLGKRWAKRGLVGGGMQASINDTTGTTECGGSCSSQRDQVAAISCSRPCFDGQNSTLHTQTLLEPSPPRPPAGGIRTQCSFVRMKPFSFFPFPSEARRTQRDRHRSCLDMTSTYIDKRIRHRPTTLPANTTHSRTNIDPSSKDAAGFKSHVGSTDTSDDGCPNKAIILTRQTIISGAAPQIRHAGRRKAASQLYGQRTPRMIVRRAFRSKSLIHHPSRTPFRGNNAFRSNQPERERRWALLTDPPIGLVRKLSVLHPRKRVPANPCVLISKAKGSVSFPMLPRTMGICKRQLQLHLEWDAPWNIPDFAALSISRHHASFSTLILWPAPALPCCERLRDVTGNRCTCSRICLRLFSDRSDVVSSPKSPNLSHDDSAPGISQHPLPLQLKDGGCSYRTRIPLNAILSTSISPWPRLCKTTLTLIMSLQAPSYLDSASAPLVPARLAAVGYEVGSLPPTTHSRATGTWDNGVIHVGTAYNRMYEVQRRESPRGTHPARMFQSLRIQHTWGHSLYCSSVAVYSVLERLCIRTVPCLLCGLHFLAALGRGSYSWS